MTGRLTLDVAIIGGGIAGCAAALGLAENGLAVGVFERRTVGSQASGVNYGGVREQGRALAELPLSRRARAIWGRLRERIGTDCDFEATGHLKLARTEAQMAGLEAFARAAAGHGLGIDLLSGTVLRARYPWLGAGIIGATLCRSDGQANPRLVAPAFAQAARRAGARIVEHDAIAGATRGAAGFHLETEAGHRVTATQIVNVAGAWGGRVAGWFGETVPLTPQSPNMQVTDPQPYRVSVNIGVAGGDIYARQTRRGNVVFGGGRGWNDIERICARAGVASTIGAIGRLTEILPWTVGAHVIRTWSGIEGFMPDELPVVGPSMTTPGLWHAFGFSGHGFQLGPGIGEILAELVVSGGTSTPLGPLSIGRFGVTVPTDAPGAPNENRDAIAAHPLQQQGEPT